MDISRDLILESADLPREEVDVPEWGGAVFVKTMTGEERDCFDTFVHEHASKGDPVKNISAYVAVMTIVDRNGNRLFTEADIVPLGRKSSLALNRVWRVAQRLNGLGAQAQEELAKN